MANTRSSSPCLALFLLFATHCIAATTTESELPFWTEGFLSALQAPKPTTSSAEQLFWTQGLPNPDNIEDLTATVTLASQTSSSNFHIAPTTIPTPSPETCNATLLTCPTCNTATITSPLDSLRYRVLCDNRLYSDSPYPVQQWLSADACLAECAKYPWCRGATSWGEGNCQLARGENVFPQADEGHIALLQIPRGYVEQPPATVPSAFPTGNLPLPPPPVQSPPAVEPGTCDLRDVSCPASRGETVTDGNGTYTVRCNYRSICDDFATILGRQSKCSCLAACDENPECLAALFNRGKCDLCHGSLEGLSTYWSPRNYVLFVSKAREIQPVTSQALISTPTALVTANRTVTTRYATGAIPMYGTGFSNPILTGGTATTHYATGGIPLTGTAFSDFPAYSPSYKWINSTTTRPTRSLPDTTLRTTSHPSPLITPSPSLGPATSDLSNANVNPARYPPLSAAVCPAADNTNAYAAGNDRTYRV